MTRCYKCSTKINRHLWIANGNTYCSPFCERSEWDKKARKWTTRWHRYGDARVEKIGISGIVIK